MYQFESVPGFGDYLFKSLRTFLLWLLGCFDIYYLVPGMAGWGVGVGCTCITVCMAHELMWRLSEIHIRSTYIERAGLK